MLYKRKQLPKYCLHKSSGRAFVRIGGKMYYLGKYSSAASRREYDRIIGEFIANGRQAFHNPDTILIESFIVSFKEGIETLLYYQRKDSVVLDKKTEQWLDALSDDLKSKLEQHGLIAVTKQKTCRLLWDTFLKYRTDDVKPRTIIYYLSCRKLFDVEFSPEDSIEVITPDRLLDWRKSLLSKYAKAGVSSRLKVVNTLLNWAVDHDWLSKNPMQKIPRGSFVNRDKDRIISMEEYAKLLDACPNQEYRTIIALARIGGLRCPSELKLLRWSDIKWEQNRFVVQSLKTEHHARHRERTVVF